MEARVKDAPEPASRAPVARPIASGDGWSISDVVCHLGPQDRREEEHFDRATIAVVLDGMFQCKTSAGTALLYPGTVLLGNARSCFECGHDHGVGDHCISFNFDAALFEEIAATVAGSDSFRFPTAILPTSPKLAWPVVESALHVTKEGSMADDELAIRVAEIVIRTLSGGFGTSPSPAPREQRRLIAALNHMEEHSEEPLTLAELCSMACMSKYHFLRSFRALYGVTPHQFLLALRLRRAAIKLRTMSMPVTTIAFETGFGDLSTFNKRFRSAFGMSPQRLRRSGKTDQDRAAH
jgi:AraC-like DNA-binding protein